MSAFVLVAEDEPKVRRLVKSALEQAGMTVECTGEVSGIREYLQRAEFDVLILDRLLGKQDSLGMVGELRRTYPRLKILFLSALGDPDQRVAGIDRGGDDYLAKPFHVSELVSRVRALARRTSPEGEGGTEIILDDLRMDLKTQRVTRTGKGVELTAKEFKLLSLLAGHPNRIYSRAELLDRVWGVNADPGSNVVEVTIKRLRLKIDQPEARTLIHTKRGSGYWCGDEDQHG